MENTGISAAARRLISDAESDYADHAGGYTAALTADVLLVARFAITVLEPAQVGHELAQSLAALRPRTTIRCEVCGDEKEVWLREKQMSRTCSGKCRQKLWRREKKAATTTATNDA